LTYDQLIGILPHRVNSNFPGEISVIFNRSIFIRLFVLISLIACLTGLSTRLQADTGNCGGVTITLPFNDVMASPFFCQIAAAYFSGLTNGTGDGTTYSPTQAVTREQMAAFISRTMDQSLKRGSQRAVAKKWWTPQDANSLTLTTVGSGPILTAFDGTDVWVAHLASNNVMRVRPSDGKVLDTWTGANSAVGVLAAMGKIFVTGQGGTGNPGRLYMIDPAQPAGTVTTLTSNLGEAPEGIAFDGSRIWTANAGGSVSIISLNPTTVTTVTTGFNALGGALFDGANIWVAALNGLHKLNSDGSIAQTITGPGRQYPVFDGINIWAPNQSANTMTVVRVKDASGNPLTNAFVLATLTGNGLTSPVSAAFDGERILVTNLTGNSVSLWKAADLTPLGSFPTGPSTVPIGACSDGLNFWITFQNAGKLARF
jgi:hypothetical protein